MVLVSALPFSEFVVSKDQRADISFDFYAHNKDFPVIDLADQDPEQLASQADAAAREYGFFQVVNHGAEAAIERMRELSKKMMLELSPDRKEAVKLSSDPRMGFAAGGYGIRFWHEGFQVPHSAEIIHDFSEKMWPDSPSSAQEFREIIGEYASKMRGIGSKFMEAFAAALGAQDLDVISKHSRPEVSSFRINYYPVCPEPSVTMGMPPHYDRHIVTLLHQDEVGGLQVCHKGEWFGLEPRIDALILIVGDALQALSNANYPSLRHRVVANSKVARTSMAYFITPCPDTVVAPLPEAVTDERPVMYRPFTGKEMLSQADAVRKAGPHADSSCLERFKV